MEKDLFHQFDNGVLAGAGQEINLGLGAWNKHKDFTGVSLKNLVTADQTSGLFTCHLVRIEPHRKIGLHAHPGSIELHEVVRGRGTCLMSQGEVHYAPGVMAVIARNELHEVRAGEEGLCLFAKFIIVQA
ncbi:MAG: cupin domain-containing protein [Desulfobulbus sp.]|nr:cupin domain-containing protein [Desulfobulbus sp.]